MEEENLVQNWIDTDKKLYDVLVEIQSSVKDEKEQAELAFYRISEIYQLPKMPEDNEEELFHSTVYEQLALLNFMEPQDNIKARVLTSLFFVKENYVVGMNFVYEKKFGNNEPPSNFVGIGYKGDIPYVVPVFVMKGQSWYELGCKYFTKEVDII